MRRELSTEALPPSGRRQIESDCFFVSMGIFAFLFSCDDAVFLLPSLSLWKYRFLQNRLFIFACQKNPQDLKCQICNYSFLPWASLIGERVKIEQCFTINWKHIFRKENQKVWEFLDFSIIQYSAYARFSWHQL